MRAKGQHSASQREAGWRGAVYYMSVTELTSHDDRSELKEEACQNTARGGVGQIKNARSRQAKGRLGGGTHCSPCR